MASFFKNMSLARFIILASAIGSIVLAYSGWKAEQTLAQKQHELDKEVQLLVAQIQGRSHEHTKYVKAVENEGFTKSSDSEAYIMGIAQSDSVKMGLVTIDKSVKHVTRTIDDIVFQIRPKNAARSFNREQIAAFLYKLEQGSRRVKVTNIQVALVKVKGKKRAQPGDIPEEGWTFKVSISVRQEVDSKKS